MTQTRRLVTDIDLDAIEARANTAADGPWVAGSRREGPTGVAILGAEREYYYADDEPVIDRPVIADLWLQPTAPGTPEFIAHARTDVPALVAEVRALRSRLGRVEEWVKSGVLIERFAADQLRTILRGKS